jgi:hypothetical protein
MRVCHLELPSVYRQHLTRPWSSMPPLPVARLLVPSIHSAPVRVPWPFRVQPLQKPDSLTNGCGPRIASLLFRACAIPSMSVLR